MRTRAKRKFVAGDRARRENVPGHILFLVIGNFNPYIIKNFRGMRTGAKKKYIASEPVSRMCGSTFFYCIQIVFPMAWQYNELHGQVKR